jgi:Ca2+-binding RTX toxin-like protein
MLDKRGLVAAGSLLLMGCSASTTDSVDESGTEPLGVIQQAVGTPLSINEIPPNIRWGGRTTAITIDPNNDNIALASTDSGGIFRTVNGGVNWSHVEGFTPFVMTDIRYSQTQANVVIATVRSDSHIPTQAGIYRSVDGGLTWTRPASSVPANCPNTGGNGIAFAPDSNWVYVGTSCSLAVSSNGGVNWTHRTIAGSSNNVLAVDAIAGGIVNVMTLEGFLGNGNPTLSGFHRSPDNGTTWPTAGQSPLGSGVDIHTVANSPVEAGVILALGFDTPTNTRWQVFESDDGGVTWTSLAAPMGGNGRPPVLQTHLSGDGDPTHFDVYYHDSASVFKQTCIGAAPNLRCGTTWTPVTVQHTDNTDFAWTRTGLCPKLMAGDGGMQTTSDCGASWTMTGNLGNGFNALQIYEVTGTVQAGHTDLYFGTQDNDSWASSDGGVTWPNVVQFEGFNIETAHTTATADGQTVAGTTCFACRTFRENAHWTAGAPNWNNPPGTSVSNPFAIDATTFVQFSQSTPPNNDLYITTDSGTNWTQTSATVVEQILPNERARIAGPAANPTLYIPVLRANNTLGLKRVANFRSGTVSVQNADVGINSLGRAAQPVFGFVAPAIFAVDPNRPNRLLAFDATDQNVKGSTNGGTSWTVDNLLTQLVRDNGKLNFNSQGGAIAFDNADGRRILVGTLAAGSLASFDDGASWMNIDGSLGATSVTAFLFDEQRADVFISSYGRGLWKMGWCGAPGGADTTPPSFTFVPPDIVTNNCGTINLGTPRAVDVCGPGAITFTNNRPTKFLPGTTLVTWTATDATGNTRTATQRVTLLLGDNPACCPTGSNIIQGTSNNDTLNGTAGSDCILGKGAQDQDTINGSGGVDYISGGGGDDVLNGGDGNDVIFGGSGQDQVNGGNDNDVLFGNDGDDTLHGNGGDDQIFGGQGQDQAFGDDQNDTLFGEDGDDTLNGGNGDDNMAGGAGNANNCSGGTGVNTFARCQTPGTNSCANGAKDGIESDIDCGRACSARCAPTKLCTSSNDCVSGVCQAGACQSSGGIATSSAGLLQATITLSTDWGSGYCAVIEVINSAFVPTNTWSAVINIPGATTFSVWNGTFSGSSGPVTVTPALSSRVIPSEGSNANIGFCANRTVSGSGTVPTLTSVTGVYN